MPRQKSKSEGYNLIRECIYVVRGSKLTPLEDDEYIMLSGKELREYAGEIEYNIKTKHSLYENI